MSYIHGLKNKYETSIKKSIKENLPKNQVFWKNVPDAKVTRMARGGSGAKAPPHAPFSPSACPAPKICKNL